MFAGARAGLKAFLRHMASSWMGFGIGYLFRKPNFWRRMNLPDRLYNSSVKADARSVSVLGLVCRPVLHSRPGCGLKTFPQSIRLEWL